MSGFLDDLSLVYGGDSAADVSLAPLTSYRVGGAADFLFNPDKGNLQPLLRFLFERQVPVTIIGEGTNILVRDRGVRGAVVRIGEAVRSLEWQEDLAVCGAGLLSARLAREAVGLGRSGFEWASALPGNLGGAVSGNAGAFGGELAGSFHSLRGWDLKGRLQELALPDLGFAYRYSSVPQDLVITSVTLSLPEASEVERKAIAERHEEVLRVRRHSQPGAMWTAGCTFKNPPDAPPAGQLIDACGLKGRAIGGAQVSERHANFIESKGAEATAADIEALMDLMAAEVERQHGIRLEREVKVIGEV